MTDHAAASQLSVTVITLNEESNIERCLKSLPAGAEVIVLDSGSTDRTQALARACGARVEVRAFTNHGEQKNAALSLANRPWVFSIDADEVMDAELRSAVLQVVANAGASKASAVGYLVCRRLYFLGQRMRFGKTVDRPLRLFRRTSAQFAAAIHEKVMFTHGEDANIGRLGGELAHYSYRDLSDYFVRFNSYTSRVAENHYRLKHRMPPVLVHCLRPWLVFFYRYIILLGFLDGYAGYTYALLSSTYSYVKYAKLRERL